MNIFTLTVVILFFIASLLEVISNHWIKASFYFLSVLINLAVMYL